MTRQQKRINAMWIRAYLECLISGRAVSLLIRTPDKTGQLTLWGDDTTMRRAA